MLKSAENVTEQTFIFMFLGVLLKSNGFGNYTLAKAHLFEIMPQRKTLDAKIRSSESINEK